MAELLVGAQSMNVYSPSIIQ